MEENRVDDVGQYKVRVRKGEWEIEISAPEKDFVLTESDRFIEQLLFNTQTHTTHETAATSEDASFSTDARQTRNIKPQTLNEFFRQFKLQTHLEKILILGYWCEIRQNQPFFTSEDILTKYKEVKEVPPANISRDLGSLRAKGLLLATGKNDEGVGYELTNTGINEVELKFTQH